MDTDSASQYRVVREDCGLWRRPDPSVIVLRGEDRTRLLNGLVTCDVAALSPGRGVRGFFTDVKGHVLAEVVVRARAEEHLLELAGQTADPIAAHIEKYIVADRVEVEESPRYEAMTLLGSGAAGRLGALLPDVDAPREPWSFVEIDLAGRAGVLTADGHFGLPAFSIWLVAEPAEGALGGWLTEVEELLPPTVGDDVVEVVRIEEAMPLFGRDYDSDNLPQESGLDAAVDFEKGCYLGQEVVARLHYRGQEARRVVLLRGTPESLPEIGSPVLLEGRDTGRITSVARRPGGEEVLALAMLQRRAFESGTEVELPDGQVLRVV